MLQPQLPNTFSGSEGPLNLSLFDQNFAFLLGLIVGMNASSVAFTDTVGLGARDVQSAIVALYGMIGASPPDGSLHLDFRVPANSQYVPALVA